MNDFTTNGNHPYWQRPHVTIKRREFLPGQWCNDILVDGKVYTAAVGDKIVHEIAAGVARAVNGRF